MLSLACACGAKSGLDSTVHPGSDAASAAIPDAAVGDTADSAPPLDAASLAQDAAPACTTTEIVLVVALALADWGPFSIEASHPSTGLLSSLGALDCSPYPRASINGLAVDRSGRFYVSLLDAMIPIDTTAGFTCALPRFGVQPLGIAFVGLPDGREALYGSLVGLLPGPPGTAALVTIDTPSGAVNVISSDASTPAGNLTGTRDGRLFVFSRGIAETVVEIDSTGVVMRTFSIGVSVKGGFMNTPPSGVLG
jgi:hypothetical protein